MSVLSDSRILDKIYGKEFLIDPCQIDNIQPSSIDLTLDEDIKIPLEGVCISPPYPDREEMQKFFKNGRINGDYVLRPGELVIAQIQETIGLSDKLVGNIQNRNSLIRLGIDVGLSTYVNPGYKGKLPIVIHNIGNFDFRLTPGMRICQLVLLETSGVTKDYSKREDAKYHDEQNITLSRLSEDREFAEYIKKHKVNGSAAGLGNFLKERIKEKSQDFFNQLTSEQKKTLGLA